MLKRCSSQQLLFTWYIPNEISLLLVLISYHLQQSQGQGRALHSLMIVLESPLWLGWWWWQHWMMLVLLALPAVVLQLDPVWLVSILFED